MQEKLLDFCCLMDLKIIESVDVSNEWFCLISSDFSKIKGFQTLYKEFYKTAKHLNRHFLRDLPFVLVSYAEETDNAAFMCRSAWRPSSKDALDIISTPKNDLILMNNLAVQIIMTPEELNEDGRISASTPYNIDFSDFEVVQDVYNLTLFFINTEKEINWDKHDISKL